MDDIRVQVNDDIVIRPYSSKYKIYIIADADLMSVQAQNALLKTIEEPPQYAVIMLLTENADTLLPTIRSRCVMMKLRNIKDQLVKKYLMEHLEIPDYKADVCVAFAQGNAPGILVGNDENYCRMIIDTYSNDYLSRVFDTKHGEGSCGYIVEAFRYYVEKNCS